MTPEILKTIPWDPTDDLQYCHDLMIAMVKESFQDHGTSPAMWLVVAPDGKEAAVIVTPWRNNFEKHAFVTTMHDTLFDGPGGGICPMYSFSCEAMMKAVPVEDYRPGTRLKNSDPEVEDIIFITSYTKDGDGLFTRFGVADAHPHGFGTLRERDDWDLGDPASTDKLDGLLMDVYKLPDDDPADDVMAPKLQNGVRCPHCHKQANMSMAVSHGRQAPRTATPCCASAAARSGPTIRRRPMVPASPVRPKNRTISAIRACWSDRWPSRR